MRTQLSQEKSQLKVEKETIVNTMMPTDSDSYILVHMSPSKGPSRAAAAASPREVPGR